MLRRTYDWMMRLAESRHAPWALFSVGFAESSFFPVPADVMLAPMVLARPQRAFVYAGIATLASVLGGMLGYAIGFYLEPVGRWLISLFGRAESIDQFRGWYGQYGGWVILVQGFIPLPFKLVTITSGLAHFNFALFVAASTFTRGARYFLSAALLKRFGPAIRAQVERRLVLFAGLAAALLAGVFVAVRVLG
jgi:membrane protein YqaA with SNARE-associated domain